MAASDTTPSPKLAQWAAIGALGVYTLALLWLTFGLSATDAGWTREVFIVNGAEAIAFAAAGWLWGTQVSRGALKATEDHVDTMKSDLQQKQDVVDSTRSELEKKIDQLGRATAAIIAAHAAASAPRSPEDDEDSGTVAGAAPGVRRFSPPAAQPDIRAMLESAYPEAFQRDQR